MDPPRLRLKSGSWEARLLRASPSLEPPAHAQEEVWRRLKGLAAVGAATGAVGLGAHSAAAAGNVAGKAMWAWALPWAAGAVLAVGVPAVGVTTYWAVHRQAHRANVTVTAAPAAPARGEEVAEGPAPEPEVAQTAAPVPVAEAPVREAPTREAPRSKTASRTASSALKAESLLLAAARAKFAAGDASGALDDVGRLGAQFPHGKLVQEREVVAIDCLAALGDRAAMRARALAFRERYPNSPYTSHVRQVLGQ
jgi:hypothetical protein